MKLSKLSTIAFLTGILFNHAVFASNRRIPSFLSFHYYDSADYLNANNNLQNDPNADDEKDDWKSSEDNVRDEGCTDMYCLLESKTPIVCMNAHDQTIYYSLKGKSMLRILDCQKGYQLKDLVSYKHPYDAKYGEIKAIACGGDVTCLTSSGKEIFYEYKEKKLKPYPKSSCFQFIYATQGGKITLGILLW